MFSAVRWCLLWEGTGVTAVHPNILTTTMLHKQNRHLLYSQDLICSHKHRNGVCKCSSNTLK